MIPQQQGRYALNPLMSVGVGGIRFFLRHFYADPGNYCGDHIGMEIQVDGEKSLRDAHEVAQRIHDKVEHAFPDVKHIMVHLNPTAEAGGLEWAPEQTN